MPYVARELFGAAIFIESNSQYVTLDSGARIRLESLTLTGANYAGAKKFLGTLYDEVMKHEHYKEEIETGKPVTDLITLDIFIDAEDPDNKKMGAFLQIKGTADSLSNLSKHWPNIDK